MTDTYSCGITAHRPEADLYNLLGLHRVATREEIEEAGSGKVLTDDQRYAWKALSDPTYREVYDFRHDTKDLFNAGFFDDGLPKLVEQYRTYNPTFQTTSLQKVRNNLLKLIGGNNGGRRAVLITTGGMAPIHNGHIAMMERAREIVEGQGFQVMGGFFAPGHDSYVSQKYNGTAGISAVHRIAMVELATQDSDWLEVDPWAARYMPGEVNFTAVARRMEAYLSQNLGQIFDVFYVYGSDNSGFQETGIPSVQVTRSEVSSKLVREGEHHHLNPRVAKYFQEYKNQDTGNLPYLIRNEEDEAIVGWANRMPGGREELTKRRVQLQSAIRLAIAHLFKGAGGNHKVHLLPVSEQKEKATWLIGDRKVISLDPFFHYQGVHHLDSTRYFSQSSSQFSALFRDTRFGFDSLQEQADSIPDGDYVLVEDDSVTGETINSARMRLGDRINITDVILLSDFADYKDDAYYDVVDLRDFIVGSHMGGLSVVLNGGQRGRAPYALPYVSLRSRAKIPPSAEMELSRVIWQANVRFFTDSGILIRDGSLDLQELANSIGWGKDGAMEDFCRWHVDALLDVV